MTTEVVITGIGVVSPIGIGRRVFFDSLEKGETGFREITLFDTSALNVHIAGEISDFDPVVFLGKKGLRTLDRSTKLVCSAAMLAIEDADLTITETNTHSIGVCIGTTFGSLHSISQFDREGLIEGPRFVNPSFFPNTVINSPASQISIRFNIKGFNTTISTGVCSGLDAISYASDFIKLGRADVVIAGAVEELCEETFIGFHNMGLLSGVDGSESLCCPFDKRRNGFILSEGAIVFVLENRKHAETRGAKIFARVQGYTSCITSEAEDALSEAISSALKDASMNPEEVEYISAGANSTVELDRLETKALKKVLGDHIYKIPVSSIKSMIGETFSAAGAFSLGAAVCALNRGFLPPTVNYRVKDPECDLDYVPNEARPMDVNSALVIASDLYGNSSVVVINKI
jgi:3-oxoacyl-[acyl-carrier-protein] synthase II